MFCACAWNIPHWCISAQTQRNATLFLFAGQLFDFDAEIGPLLEVVASKTLEQSLLEVEEEAELKRIRRRQLELTQIQQRRRQKIHELELEKRHEWEEKEQCVIREQDRVAKETVVYRYTTISCVCSGVKHPPTHSPKPTHTRAHTHRTHRVTQTITFSMAIRITLISVPDQNPRSCFLSLISNSVFVTMQKSGFAKPDEDDHRLATRSSVRCHGGQWFLPGPD